MLSAVASAVAAVGTVGALWFLAVGQKQLREESRRARDIAKPELALDVFDWHPRQPNIPIAAASLSVRVRWLKGSLTATDIHVIVRIQDNFWLGTCPDLGPSHLEEFAEARNCRKSAIDQLHTGLPQRPFLHANTTDSAAAVTWRAEGRRHWAGSEIQTRTAPGQYRQAIGEQLHSGEN